MKTFENIAIGVPDILLPKAGTDLTPWAVVACDQYTSEPEYWQSVAELVGDAPSTLHLIYPEVFLSEPDGDARIKNIQSAMRRYVDEGLLESKEGFLYVERIAAGKLRKGLMVAMDLDAYDYQKGSQSLVRATEGTIVDRLPPRIRVREGAPIELPHIMVLIDDPKDTVFGPLSSQKESFETRYDFELMKDGGHLTGYHVSEAATQTIADALTALAAPEKFQSRYGLDANQAVLLYAMGDGNHSLATAKAIWEKVKADGASSDDPRRYALVELVNVHDASLEFEPIHRVLFDVKDGFDFVSALTDFVDGGLSVETVVDVEAMTKAVEAHPQSFGVVSEAGYQVASITKPKGNLSVATVQAFLNDIADKDLFKEVDYVHGTSAVDRLGKASKNLGVFLPGMDKNELFKTVVLDGALPRKTFSMGEADEKRFYMEARSLGA